MQTHRETFGLYNTAQALGLHGSSVCKVRRRVTAAVVLVGAAVSNARSATRADARTTSGQSVVPKSMFTEDLFASIPKISRAEQR